MAAKIAMMAMRTIQEMKAPGRLKACRKPEDDQYFPFITKDLSSWN
jgi:hypothetical protein